MRLAPAVLALMLCGASMAAAQTDDTAILRAFETRYSRAVEKAATVAVSIKVDRIKDTATPAGRGNPFMSGGVFGIRPLAPVSGLIVSADGWIATSYFNVQGDLRGIEVTLPDGTVLPAKLVGWHVGADLALLKVAATGLPTLPGADPAEIRAGDMVVAVGRDPDGRGVTANQGILSAAGRHRGRSVQVDSRLNYGNVGGPLVDLEGRLVGMTCKISMSTAGERGQNSGVSFAILQSKMAELYPELKEGKQIKGGEGKPYLGIIGDINYQGKDGAKVTDLVQGASAEKAGLQRGDIIQGIDGVNVVSFEDLRIEISRRKIGDIVKVKIRRGAEQVEIQVPLGENPGE
jgi:serine protease Do